MLIANIGAVIGIYNTYIAEQALQNLNTTIENKHFKRYIIRICIWQSACIPT